MRNLFELEDRGRNDISVKILELKNCDIDIIDSILKFDECEYKVNAVKFNGHYKPDKDESLKIEDFVLPNEITRAISNPLGIEKLCPKNDNELNIRAIFKIVDPQR